ncbi:MAG: hypothetical protein JO279_09025 [Verrucomicrobia bacterium]|nr:hypothetical protein [Verrucomicrobiota bacterium]
MKHIFLAAVLFAFTVAAKAADHTIHLHIVSYGDQTGWHFSRYDGPETWKTIIKGTSFGFNLGRGKFTRVQAEDGSTRRMARNEKYNQTFHVSGPGVYILVFSDWNPTSRVEVTLEVDGEVWFRGSGSSTNMYNWTKNWRKWIHVRQTDDREIAFYLD